MDQNHHLLSGFKALFSDDNVAVTEAARRSTGGAGFASFSGFPTLFANYAPIPTYEGDNIVMLGQASRYLMKLVKRASK
jgi:hypothetical protein